VLGRLRADQDLTKQFKGRIDILNRRMAFTESRLNSARSRAATLRKQSEAALDSVGEFEGRLQNALNYDNASVQQLRERLSRERARTRWMRQTLRIVQARLRERSQRVREGYRTLKTATARINDQRMQIESLSDRVTNAQSSLLNEMRRLEMVESSLRTTGAAQKLAFRELALQAGFEIEKQRRTDWLYKQEAAIFQGQKAIDAAHAQGKHAE